MRRLKGTVESIGEGRYQQEMRQRSNAGRPKKMGVIVGIELIELWMQFLEY